MFFRIGAKSPARHDRFETYQKTEPRMISLLPPQELRQLGEVDSYPPRLVARKGLVTLRLLGSSSK